MWGGGSGGCGRRIEVFVKIQKKIWGCGRVDVIKVFGKIHKKKYFFFLGGGGGGRGGGGVGVGLVGWGGVRVDVNEELNFL